MSASGDSPAPSQSSIVADTVSGSHVFTIHGYSKTKGLGTGKSIASSPFDAAGHTWVIEYYPDGFDDSSADCISIFLRLADIHAKVNARYKLSLLDETGEPALTMHSQGIRLFSRWGFNRFIERKNFERQTRSGWWRWTRNNNSLTYLKNDSFRVRCDITVLKEIRTEDVTVRSSGVVVPPSDIGQQLGCLLESGVGADVQFDVAGETFAAHKCILAARSPVFMAELFGPMKEKTESCVRIDDMEARVFKAFLHFIYNDSLPNIDKGDIIVMAQHILVAANRYSLDRLKLVCEDKLCRYIEADTVAKTLVLAEQHDCDMLKESCFQFLRSHGNLKAAMASDGFDHLTSSCPPIVKELLAKVSTDLSPLGSRKN
ncbi:hypothetical protein EJB05_26582, partial [Eragrostis curvula]